MAEKGPSAPKIPLTPKTTRAKATDQAKATGLVKGRDPSQKNPPKENLPKQIPPLEPQVVVVPVDQAQDQAPPNAQNPPDTNPPPHIPNPPPPSNLTVHLQNISAHIPNTQPPPLLPGHIPNPPAQVPDPEELQNPPPQVPYPVQTPNPPAQVPNPVSHQIPHHLHLTQCNLHPPAQVPNLMVPQTPPAQVAQLNWSYFKPGFSGKPQEDVEAHLLRTNDWMETHNFPEVAKGHRFCLTHTGEARLWYETLRPIEVDWTGLQEHFRQQYSKFVNTREQLFHAWRSFHYDENTETIDSYVSRIKQVAALLNYGEPQILELFKNTLHSKLHWILFSINNLRDAVDATKKC